MLLHVLFTCQLTPLWLFLFGSFRFTLSSPQSVNCSHHTTTTLSSVFSLFYHSKEHLLKSVTLITLHTITTRSLLSHSYIHSNFSYLKMHLDFTHSLFTPLS